MALQDLTPQMRTRLNRVERGVGWFIAIATLLLVVGFAYYLYDTARRKGWFVPKVEYSTSINNAAGLNPGAQVFLMGFPAGRITRVIPNAPEEWYNVTVYFEIDAPYFGYLWTDSQVRVTAADLLGNRVLEVTKGRDGIATVFATPQGIQGILNQKLVQDRIEEEFRRLDLEIGPRPETETAELMSAARYRVKAAVLENPEIFYQPVGEAEVYWLDPLESPAIGDRLEQVLNVVESALPNILILTNQLSAVLSNSVTATARLDELLAEAKPVVNNLTTITENLREPNGALGDWLFPTNLNVQLEQTLKSADTTLRSADRALQSTEANLGEVLTNATRTLDNLANITSNLNAQVEVNTNILSEVSTAVTNADELVQGLKRHWLLRSAFRDERPAPPRTEEPRRLLPPRLRP